MTTELPGPCGSDSSAGLGPTPPFAPAGYRTRYRSEPGMIGHYPWTYADQGRRRADRPSCEYEDLFTGAQVRQMIEGAWCAGYYDAGYTHDSAYAVQQSAKCAADFLGSNDAAIGTELPPLPYIDPYFPAPITADLMQAYAANASDPRLERCEQAPKCLCFDKSGRQVCGCYIKHTDRALKKMEAATELRRSKLRAKLGPGVCLECEGEGEQGGQFCGGYWACEACGGTGKDTA